MVPLTYRDLLKLEPDQFITLRVKYDVDDIQEFPCKFISYEEDWESTYGKLLHVWDYERGESNYWDVKFIRLPQGVQEELFNQGKLYGVQIAYKITRKEEAGFISNLLTL